MQPKKLSLLSLSLFSAITLTACNQDSPISLEQAQKAIDVADKVADVASRALDKAGRSVDISSDKAGAGLDNIHETIDNIDNMLSGDTEITPAKQPAKAEKKGKYDITSCYVTKISDGDTATCLNQDSSQVKIRFAQIDAPESKQEFGSRSRQALADLIFNKKVDLKIEETDRYGRSVAEVFFKGQNINKQMVKDGYAWAYKEYNKDKEYLELQKQAQAQKIGLWSHKNPMYPQDFRKKQAAEREQKKAQQQ